VNPYIEAVEEAFRGQIDYAQLVKYYGTDPQEDRKFSPPVVLAQDARIITGQPERSKISTSYVERQNLTMRMGMRRFTRLTNGFSKKVENHGAAIAIHFMWMNYGRPPEGAGKPVSPDPGDGRSPRGSRLDMRGNRRPAGLGEVLQTDQDHVSSAASHRHIQDSESGDPQTNSLPCEFGIVTGIGTPATHWVRTDLVDLVPEIAADRR
jgi:hypothetical protein